MSYEFMTYDVMVNAYIPIIFIAGIVKGIFYRFDLTLLHLRFFIISLRCLVVKNEYF